MATHSPTIGGHVEGFGATTRTDGWWHLPVVTVVVFLSFVVYTTWAALQGNHYHWGPYLSPFYSPLLFSNDPTIEGWFGSWPTWWPSFIPASPAILILVFPGSFRFTCYYYRKAYYRSFAGSPPGCAVGPLAGTRPYKGETWFLLFQNTGGAFKQYDVRVDPGMVVLDVLHRIQAEQANDLALRWNCKAGKCGSCSMEINGKRKISCMTRMNSFAETETITVQPLKTFPSIKDLVTDVSWNYAQNTRIPKFKPRPTPCCAGTAACGRLRASVCSRRRAGPSCRSSRGAALWRPPCAAVLPVIFRLPLRHSPCYRHTRFSC